MKKTNKGFSMVELIIVIAIMAILAGALAPALIKYINKSRVSTDIQTGQTIATAIQTALSNEAGYDCADAMGTGSQTLTGGGNWATGDAFMESVANTVGGKTIPKVKSKKCVAKGAATNTGGNFIFTVDAQKNEVYVYIGAAGSAHQVYPDADNCLSDDTTTTCDGHH